MQKYCCANMTICKEQMFFSQPKKSGKWKDWLNVKVVGADHPSSWSCNEIL